MPPAYTGVAPQGTEQFCRIVSARSWKRVLVFMLTACFDAAGKEQENQRDRIMAVAGFAGFGGQWKEFDERWSERLKRDGLPYFHAGQFAHSEGPFRTWKGASLSSDLMAIIKDAGLRKFGSVLHVDGYIKTRKKYIDQGYASLHPFAFAAMRAVDSFHAFARAEGVLRNVECVFEKGDPETDLRKLFAEYGYAEPFFKRSTPHRDRKGFEHDPFLGLEAAGWITYEYYLDSERLLFSQATDRWALQQFEALPGDILFLYRDAPGPPLMDEQKMHDALAESIERLEHARNEGAILES